jgi:hypothetical protein
MDGNEYISAFADISDDLIPSASDDAAVRKAFRRYRSRRNQMIGALCFCIVVAAIGFGARNWFPKTPAVTPGETAGAEHRPTAQTENQPTDPAPGVIPPETVSDAESENREPTTAGEQPGTSEKETAQPDDNTGTHTEAPLETPSDDASVIWEEGGGTSSSAYVLWNGKQVGYELWEILQPDTAGKTVAIVASPSVNAQFVYNGKTLAQYEDDAYYERRGLPDKLQQLMKEGDVLKYGEALYTTGTPDGEKWAKDLYESKVAYYGTEMLSRYIVNGNFLVDQVAADLSLAQKATAAQDAYKEALAAYYSQTVAAAVSAFSAAGLPCSVTQRGNAILLFASAQSFAGLTAPDNAEWYFSLAQKNPYETVRE